MMGDINITVKFVARQAKYVVPDVETVICNQCTTVELKTIVNKLLNPDVFPEKFIDFEFFVLDDVLRSSLDKHLQDRNVQKDDKIIIEYYEKLPAPSVGELLLHDDWVASVQALNQDIILTGCYDGSVQLWSSNGKLLRVIAAHKHAVKAVAWLNVVNDEKIFVTGSDDGSCIIWSWTVTDKDVKNFEGLSKDCKQELGEIKLIENCPMPKIGNKLKNYTMPRNVQTVAVSSDKAFFASGNSDGIINIWSSVQSNHSASVVGEVKKGKKKRKVEVGEEKLPIQTMDGEDAHTNQVSKVEWMNADKICSSSSDHSIKFWDIRTGEMESSIAGSKIFLDHSYSPLNGTIITGSVDRHVRLYDPRITSGSVVNSTFTSHTGWVSCVNWCPNEDHLFISGSYDSVAKLWDIRRPKAPLFDMMGHDDKILCCDWSVPNLMLSGGADNQLQIFNKN